MTEVEKPYFVRDYRNPRYPTGSWSKRLHSTARHAEIGREERSDQIHDLPTIARMNLLSVCDSLPLILIHEWRRKERRKTDPSYGCRSMIVFVFVARLRSERHGYIRGNRVETSSLRPFRDEKASFGSVTFSPFAATGDCNRFAEDAAYRMIRRVDDLMIGVSLFLSSILFQ